MSRCHLALPTIRVRRSRFMLTSHRRPLAWLRYGLVIGALTSVAAAPRLSGQTSPTLTTDVDSAETTIGGRITLTVRVRHGEGERVVFPDSLSLDPFEVLGVEVGEPEPLDDGLWSWARYTLTVFELGDLEIPSFEVALVAADGEASVLETHPYGIVVASVGRDESGDIRDVKSPLEIPLGLVVLLARILAVMMLLAVLYALYRRFRKQPAASPIDVSAPLRRPYEVAYDQLRELEGSGVLERGEVKEYYIRVSEIIRAYVEAQYYVPALEMASFEVLENLEGIGVDDETLRDFEGFLAECDLVKFAKFVPDASRARQIVPRARKLVERTKVGRPAPVRVPAAVVEGPEVAATNRDSQSGTTGASETLAGHTTLDEEPQRFQAPDQRAVPTEVAGAAASRATVSSPETETSKPGQVDELNDGDETGPPVAGSGPDPGHDTDTRGPGAGGSAP